jgi:NAD(P)H-dependent FMN reductase
MSGSSETLNVMVIIASTRPTRVGGAIGDWIAEQARSAAGWAVTVADLRELDLPMLNEPKHPAQGDYEHPHTRLWSAMVNEQDAFIIVMPEYNHSFTGPLKNALDTVSKEWAQKPVGIVSYGGVSGGLRAATAIKPVLTALKMMPLAAAVTIPSVSEHVQDGVFVPYDSATSSAATMLTELRRWALALEPLRTGGIPA